MNKWKTILISLIISLLFALASYFMPNEINLFWAIVICILTFAISYVFIELLIHTKNIEDSDINSEYKFFKECGISEYQSDFTKINFSACISGSNHIRVMLLYSNRFIRDNINELRSFIARDGSVLEFILLTNDIKSSSHKSVAEKFGYEEIKLKEKIDDFIAMLRDDLMEYKNEKSTIDVYLTELIPMYSLYMFDDYSYITLYKTAPQRTNLIPCFRVEKAYDSSFFNFMVNDFNEIKKNPKTSKCSID